MIIASELFGLECGHWDSCLSMYVACVAQLQISLAAIASGEKLQRTHNDIHPIASFGGTIALTLKRGAAKPEDGS